MIKKIRATSLLIARTFFGQPIGIIMSFVTPTILTIMFPYLFKGMLPGGMDFVMELLFPGILILPIFIIGNVAIPITYSTLRENGILKRMNVTGVTPFIFIFSLIMVFTLIIFLSILSQLIISLIFFHKSLPSSNGSLFVVPMFLLIFVSITFGLLISNISNSQALAFAIGMATFLPIMFLSGTVFANMTGWVKDISWFIPHSGFVGLYRMAFHEGTLNLENYNVGFQSINTHFFGGDGTIWSFAWPISITILQIGIIFRKFKFE